MSKELEAVSAVTSLNEDFLEKNPDADISPFVLTFDGNSKRIEFCGAFVWCDEDDERKWIEKEERYEDLLPYLKAQSADIISQLNKAYSTSDGKTEVELKEKDIIAKIKFDSFNNSDCCVILTEQAVLIKIDDNIEVLFDSSRDQWGVWYYFDKFTVAQEDCTVSFMDAISKAVKMMQFRSEVDTRSVVVEGQVAMSGTALIEAERLRQIYTKGMSYAHDDTHDNGDLINAAIGYSCAVDMTLAVPPLNWPWSSASWKPAKFDKNSDKSKIEAHIRNLTKSGALIAAEIDRLQRKLIKESNG
jgi:hypothetical protein